MKNVCRGKTHRPYLAPVYFFFFLLNLMSRAATTCFHLVPSSLFSSSLCCIIVFVSHFRAARGNYLCDNKTFLLSSLFLPRQTVRVTSLLSTLVCHRETYLNSKLLIKFSSTYFKTLLLFPPSFFCFL